MKNIGELRRAAEAGDQSKIQSIANDAEQTEQRADEVAREIGLRECAARIVHPGDERGQP